MVKTETGDKKLVAGLDSNIPTSGSLCRGVGLVDSEQVPLCV